MNMKVESFMAEFTELTQANPSNHRERVWNSEVCFDLKPFNNSIRLSNIRALNSGRGNGTLGLIWLRSLADKHDVSITGTAEPTGLNPRLNRATLKAWYRRHGFDVSRDEIEYTPADDR